MCVPLKVERNKVILHDNCSLTLHFRIRLFCLDWYFAKKSFLKPQLVTVRSFLSEEESFYNLQAHMQRNQLVHFLSLCVNLFDWGCFCVGESGERNSKRESGLPYRLVVMVIKEGVLCERWCFRDIAATIVLFYHCRKQHWGLPCLLFLHLHFYIFPNTRKEFGLLSFASAVQTFGELSVSSKAD